MSGEKGVDPTVGWADAVLAGGNSDGGIELLPSSGVLTPDQEKAAESFDGLKPHQVAMERLGIVGDDGVDREAGAAFVAVCERLGIDDPSRTLVDFGKAVIAGDIMRGATYEGGLKERSVEEK